ncbi:hypothetical protein [Nocardia sp. AG03]|uniref:hypothetical protein n=1 Tax=Nocardia sp. AG03 TaxID=3025312 RepID=UPI0024181FBF|nr:hypothetical protein [Nocardia sp. AG03]
MTLPGPPTTGEDDLSHYPPPVPTPGDPYTHPAPGHAHETPYAHRPTTPGADGGFTRPAPVSIVDDRLTHPAPELPLPPRPDTGFTHPAPVSTVDDRLTHPAPELPLPPRPDTVFAAPPGTAARLAHRGALRVALSPGPLIAMVGALLVLLPIAVVLGLWLHVAAVAALTVGAPTLSYVVARRRLRRSFAVICAPGAVMAVQLGPDALDVADAYSYVRVGYERVTAVRTSGAVVVLHVDSALRLNFPRELFPAPMAEHLRHLIWHRDNPRPGGPPPLPPLPTLLEPQARLVADDTTARALFTGDLRVRIAQPAVLIRFTLATVFATAGFGWYLGPVWTTVPILFAAATAYTVYRIVHSPGPDAGRSVRHAVPGAVLATQFGADAVVCETSTHLRRHRYTEIAAIDLHPEIAVLRLTTGEISTLPRALFPEQIVTWLRQRGLSITTR